MSLCPRCGSILDGPRENPKTRRYGRKCISCLQWQSVPASDLVIGNLRRHGGRQTPRQPGG
jgi:hypothetical protein